MGEALPAVSPQNESVLPRMSDRAIAQAHLNYENAKSWLSVAETEGANFQNWLTEHPTGWAMRGQALQEGLAASLETNPVTREMWLGIEQPPGKSVPDLLHIGEGAARPFADVFPLNPRQLAGHLKGRWYSPHIEPLVYPQPPPGWNPRVP